MMKKSKKVIDRHPLCLYRKRSPAAGVGPWAFASVSPLQYSLRCDHTNRDIEPFETLCSSGAARVKKVRGRNDVYNWMTSCTGNGNQKVFYCFDSSYR